MAARRRRRPVRAELATALLADTATPLAILRGLILRLLRLTLAPISTLAAPPRQTPEPPPASAPHLRKATKTARFLVLTAEREGPLASIPLHRVAGIATALTPQADLHPGAGLIHYRGRTDRHD